MHGLVALAVVRLGLTLTLGPEWDSNANRAEVVAGVADPDHPTSSFLLRMTVLGTLAWRHGDNILNVSANLGGKIYFNPAVFDQDVLVAQAAAEDRARVTRFFHLAAAADYYDAWQLPVDPYRHRDFRSGRVVARAYFVDPLGEVTLTGGYRGFQYKPDPYFDFQAGTANVRAVARAHFGPDGEHELDVAAVYSLERRYFTGVAQLFDANQPGCAYGQPIIQRCVVAGTEARNDWFHEGGIELTYVGPLLVAIGYGLQLNLSNSFGEGESLLRQMFTLKLAYRLPWNLYATLKAQLYINKYLDPLLLDQTVINSQTFVTIEDENRNAVIIDVERPIGSTGLALDARYSIFTNELSATPVSFLRQLVYLGLTYRVGAR